MAHSISYADEQTVLIEYTGLVGYDERAEALVAAAARVAQSGARRVLIDFTHAVTFEEDTAHRADFIAKSIVAWDLANVTVAFVGVSRHFAWPAELALQIRHIPTHLCDGREEAMRWLRQSDRPDARRGSPDQGSEIEGNDVPLTVARTP